MSTPASQIMDNAAVAAGALDLTAIDAVSDASTPYRFEVKDPAGKSYPTPLYFIVLGRQSNQVNDFYTKQVNEYISRNDLARKRGKTVEAKTAQQMREDNINGAAIRVVAWEGVRQTFDRDVLKAALMRNPHWIDQIIEESDDVGNFTPKPSTT